MATKDVVVIGGGIAGLTAAYHLARQGTATSRPFRVTVLEAEHETGGQARAFEVAPFRAKTPEESAAAAEGVAAFRQGRGEPPMPEKVTVEHGSHVFFNYYDTIIKLIEELRGDPALGKDMPSFERIPGWTILDPYGRRATLVHEPGLPGRYGVAPSILRIPWLSFVERLQLCWGAFQITQKRYSEFDTLDQMTSLELARSVGYSEVGAMTWNAASLGLTNLFVNEQSGAMFAGKHLLLINTPDGLSYRLPAGNLTHMFARPMTQRLQALGAAVVTSAEVKNIERPTGSDRTRVTYGKDGAEAEIEADHVILATRPQNAAALVPWVKAPWKTLEPVTPVITLVLKLSGRIARAEDPRELGCSREHWAFSVVTDLSSFWKEFAGDKSVIRVEIGHADRLPGGLHIDQDELVRIVMVDLARIFPEIDRDGIRVEWAALHREGKHLYTKWVKGQFSKKPAERDVGQGVYLAGDWTTKGTIGMEAAANSGVEAANHVLGAEKMRKVEYRDVPVD